MAQAIPIISIVATVASTAFSIISSISGGKAESKAAERAAAQARLAAQREAEDKEKEHRRILAIQRARYGASGLTMEGTPLLVQMESLKESQEELRRILEGGEMKAEESEAQGEAAMTKGYMGAGTSLLKGAGSLIETGYKMPSYGKTWYWW